jgi:hypothetical protein
MAFTMSSANILYSLMATIIAGLLVWRHTGDWWHAATPDMPTRQRRYRLGWEVRGLVVVTVIPCAVGMARGHLSDEYIMPLLLFAVTGLLIADTIAPSGLRSRRHRRGA